MNKIFEEIKNNADFFKNYYKKEHKLIDEKLLEPKLTELFDENNKKIRYYNEFVLINSDLKNSIIVNKYKKTFGDYEFIINMGMIILLLNYHPFCQLLNYIIIIYLFHLSY